MQFEFSRKRKRLTKVSVFDFYVFVNLHLDVERLAIIVIKFSTVYLSNIFIFSYYYVALRIKEGVMVFYLVLIG